MNAHTKGTWSINDWPQGDAEIRLGAPGTPRIATVHLRDVSINEQHANARLIAEAGTVATETGKTPRQLADDRADLLQVLYMQVDTIHEAASAKARWLIQRDTPVNEVIPYLSTHDEIAWYQIMRAAIAKAEGGLAS
jgi:hypothetical protein